MIPRNPAGEATLLTTNTCIYMYITYTPEAYMRARASEHDVRGKLFKSVASKIYF